MESPLGFPDDATAAAVSPARAAVSPQDHLEPVLVEHYRSLGMGEIRFATELVSFEADDAGVTAVLRDRSSGAISTVRCAYLVGADGHRSAVRDGLGIAMDGPADLGQFLSILFRADLTEVLGPTVYGLYQLPGPAGPDGPPRVVVPSGADDRFVLGVPLPPGMPAAAIEAAFPRERCVRLVREAAGRPRLEVEIVATNAFAFAAQTATRMRDGRVSLVGDAVHRMTPRGGRGMNTAIADAYDLGWKLAWTYRGLAGPALLDSYESERAPIGRRNVALSMVPGGGGTDDGLAEDLGPLDAAPGSRAPHLWLTAGAGRRSTLDLFGRELVLLTADPGSAWRSAGGAVLGGRPELPLQVIQIGGTMPDEARRFAAAYGIASGGAVLVRPDGIVAWRWPDRPARPAAELRRAIDAALGQRPASGAVAAGPRREAA